MQSAKLHDFLVIDVRLFFVAGVNLVPLNRRTLELGAVVIKNDIFRAVLIENDLSTRRAQLVSNALLDRLLASHKFSIAAQQDIGTAPGHVGCYRDSPDTAGLRYDFGLAFMVFGVQHHVLDALLLEQIGKPLRLLNGGGSSQDWTALNADLLNLVGYSEVFFLLRPIDNVGILNPEHLPVGGNYHDLEFVDLIELRSFRFGGAGHSAQLLVHTEVVLEGNGGQRLVFELDLDALLGFNCLM